MPPESLQLTVLSRLSCRRTHARARVWHLTFPMKIAIEAKPTPRTETVKQSISQLSQQSCEFASSCRFVSPSRFHKTGSMFIKHGIPGGTNFSRFCFAQPPNAAHNIRTRFYIGFNSYRDVLEFHRKTNDTASYTIFEK